MKTYSIISVFALMVSACHNDDVRPVMRTEAKIGEPFIVSAPAEVRVEESGLTLYIDTFSEYVDFSVEPARTGAAIRYRDRRIFLHHNLDCDQRDCEGYTYDENTFNEEAKLDELYTIKFDKVIASTVVKEYEPRGKSFVSTARSLLYGLIE